MLGDELAKVLADIRAGMSRTTAMTRAALDGEERARFVCDHDGDMARAEADFEAEHVALLAVKLRDDKASVDDVLKVLERRRKGWRSPETKLKEKMANAEAERQLTAAPPTSVASFSLSEIERELALRRGIVQVIQARPVKTAEDLKLLEAYREPPPAEPDED